MKHHCYYIHLAAVILVLLLLPSTPLAQTQTIIADENSYSLKAGFAFGASFFVEVYPIQNLPEQRFRVQVTDNSPIEEEWWRSIFQFDLEGVTEPVESAIFKVYYTGFAPTVDEPEFTTQLWASSINRASSIPPSNITAALREYDDGFNGNNSYVTLTAQFINPSDETGRYVEFDVTNFINARINSAINTGNTWVFFRLQPDTFSVDTGYRTLKNFASQFDTGFRPKLVLNESPADDVPVEQIIADTEGWRMFSSPVENGTFGDLLSGIWTQGFEGADSEAGDANVFTYSEGDGASDASSRGYAPAGSASLEMFAGQGFAAFVFEDDNPLEDGVNGGFPKILNIEGIPHSGTIEPPVSITLSGGSYTDSDDGWNLVGNPFPFDINWDTESAWNKEGLDNTIYIYDPAAGDYLTWNGVSGTLPDGKIASWQGFWVKANNTDTPFLSVDESAEDSGAEFYRSESQDGQLMLKLEQGEKTSSTLIYFNDEARDGFDTFSAFKLMPLESEFLTLFSLSDEATAMDITSLPRELAAPVEIDLGILSTHYLNAETLTLSWEPLDMPGNLMAELYNRKTGETVDLNSAGEYSFDPTTEMMGDVANKGNRKLNAEAKTVAAEASGLVIRIHDEQPTDISQPENPQQMKLSQNYPNPFNPTTLISFELPESAEVRLEVFNMLGQSVAVLVDESMSSGAHTVNFDGSQLTSGVYVYRLRSGNQTLIQKMTLVK